MLNSIVRKPFTNKLRWLVAYLFLVSLGLVVAIKQAPFYIPDEGAHFLRAYEVSRLHLINVRGSVGTAMPCNEYALVATKYHLIAWAQTKTIEEQNDSSCTVNTKNTAGVYSFVPYIPAAVAMRFVESFGGSVEVRLAVSRAVGFIVWFTLIALALHRLQHGQLLIGCLVLMPSFFWQLAAVSADGATLTSCLIYVLTILHILQKQQSVARREMTLLLVIAALIGASKGVYAPLCLLSFATWDLVPAKNNVHRLALLSTPMIGCLVVYSIFTGLADPSLIYLGNGANPSLQIHHVIDHPTTFSRAVLTSIQEILNIGFISPSYAVPNAGRGLGITVFMLVACSVLAVFSRFQPSRKIRLIAALVSVLLCFAVCLPLYLTYCPVGYDVIYGLQARYFLPILPVLYIALAFDITRINWEKLGARFVWVAVLPLIGLFLACMNIP